MYKQFRDPFSGEITWIIHVESGMFIPFDSGNRDYQEYQEWLAKGNEPLPPDDQE